jgi:hypothetical protein
MRVVGFICGFLLTSAVYALVAHIWLNHPDAMSESSALILFVYAVAIACSASSLAFSASLWAANLRPSVRRCLLYGAVMPIAAAALTAVESQLFKPSPWSWSGSPLIPLAILVASSIIIPWLTKGLLSK